MLLPAHTTDSGIDFIQAVEDHLAEYKGHTLTAKRTDLIQYLAWCDTHGVHPMKVTARQLKRWRLDHVMENYKLSTACRKISSVKGLYKELAAYGAVDFDPAQALKHPPFTHQVPEVSETGELMATVRAALKAAPDVRSESLVAAMFYTAARRQELLDADVTDVFYAEGRHYLRLNVKGGKIREVPLVNQVAEPLFRQIGDRTEGPIWTNARGGRLSGVSAWQFVADIGQVIGVDLHPHLFRHFCVTYLLDAGYSVAEVADFVGHDDQRTTRKYDLKRRRARLVPEFE